MPSSVLLTVKDENAFGHMLSQAIITFPAERITVRQLIVARIEQEVERYNAGASADFVGLVKPCEAEIILNGARKGRLIDVNQQKQAALAAFQANAFFLLINDRQVTELEQNILITPNTKVAFVKLVPLIGG
ncbi:hypothetical protein ORJ04_06330 [Rheinheimera baltica]|uniref:Uncharacterized protein n=1 Tax=Rheinheimera baltica TaxID=67576 RepID=A0ABT9HWR7_9GAMM|nr:hypothetical protein [Rheinheimera baltica]MDP5135565.1 hypothetical protein [Rheinheimera baltica]